MIAANNNMNTLVLKDQMSLRGSPTLFSAKNAAIRDGAEVELSGVKVIVMRSGPNSGDSIYSKNQIGSVEGAATIQYESYLLGGHIWCLQQGAE